MINPPIVASDLRAHLAVCQECLKLAERENQLLLGSIDAKAPKVAEAIQGRRKLLPQLTNSVAQLRKHRVEWQRLSEAERHELPQLRALLRANQDVIMKVLVLERENDQARLRRGLVPPTQLPLSAQQRPHFVSELYRRHTA